VLAIAESLRSNLLEAAALPPPAALTSTGQVRPVRRGPHDAPDGRTPWIRLGDIAVSCVDDVILVSYRWKPDNPATASRYRLPLTDLPSAVGHQ
jgi:hypothetical protein